ncbi:MAG: adenosine deaminase [Candidatus Limnocylindrales bacterium]
MARPSDPAASPPLSEGASPDEPDPQAPSVHADQRAYFRALPKAELHLHLDGSLRPATALLLARERGLATAADDAAAMHARLVAPLPCRDQAELLRAFDLPIALLQDAQALEQVAHELVEDGAADGTRYVEIRWAPALHTARGLRLRDGLGAVVTGVRSGSRASAARGRPVVTRLIVVAMRSHPPEANASVARAAVTAAPDGVTGFDLAGPEAAFPDPLQHRRAFEIARAGGLGITIHAGEWGGAAQVRRALALAPQRIAHGAPAADDPALMAELRDRAITLDVCPTSNWQAGLVASLEVHPLPRLVRAGVPVTISTDDRTVSDLTLPREYGRAHELLGLSVPELVALDRHALEVAFLHDDEPMRGALRAEFAAFSRSWPGPRG